VKAGRHELPMNPPPGSSNGLGSFLITEARPGARIEGFFFGTQRSAGFAIRKGGPTACPSAIPPPPAVRRPSAPSKNKQNLSNVPFGFAFFPAHAREEVPSLATLAVTDQTSILPLLRGGRATLEKWP